MQAAYHITADQIADYASVFYHSKRVPLFIGKPGIAKTAFVREAALRLGETIGQNVIVREMHLASMSEVDVRGYLIPNGDTAVFTKPEFWQAVEQSPYGILFPRRVPAGDSRGAESRVVADPRRPHRRVPPAPGLVRHAGGQWHRRRCWCQLLVDSYRQPRGHHLRARSGSGRVGDVGPAAGAAVRGVGVREVPPRTWCSIRTFPASPDTPYCTCRSLHAAGDLANAYPGGIKAMIDERPGMAMLCGAIGSGPASELVSVVRTAINLPSYESVISDPMGARIPMHRTGATPWSC